MTIAQLLLPELEQEAAQTRKILERIPEDKFDYKPHEKSMTLGRLAAHVAELPSWGTMTLHTEVLEMSPDWKPFVPTTRAEVTEKFETSFAEYKAALEKATDADLGVMWSFKAGGKTIMSMPRHAVLRGVVMNHLVHHRAQLGVYLRLNNIELPGMYGPSADEAKFWQPQEKAASS
jgi:uncharacterized damage-inducible protein DinB